jgi:hypothetical protein
VPPPGLQNFKKINWFFVTCSWIVRFRTAERQLSSKLIWGFSTIPIEIPERFSIVDEYISYMKKAK